MVYATSHLRLELSLLGHVLVGRPWLVSSVPGSPSGGKPNHSRGAMSVLQFLLQNDRPVSDVSSYLMMMADRLTAKRLFHFLLVSEYICASVCSLG